MSEEDLQLWFESHDATVKFTRDGAMWCCVLTTPRGVYSLTYGDTREVALDDAITHFNRTHCGAV